MESKINDLGELVEFLGEKFDKIDARFCQIDQRFDGIEKRLDEMPTKAYIDNKMAEMEGRFTTLYLKNDFKTTRLAIMLRDGGNITAGQLKELSQIQLSGGEGFG